MQLLKHFHKLSIHPKNAGELKGLILQLAVQGKLTADWRKQNPNIEPAKELLNQVQKKKEQLIKNKKLRKEKSLPLVSKNEINFKIPKYWIWCRVGDLTTIKGGKRIPKGYQLSEVKTNHVYIRVTDMKNGTIISSKLKYISDEVFHIIKNYTISKDDLYITIAGTIGDVGVIPDKLDNMNLTENAAKIINYGVDKIFLRTLLSSQLCQRQFLEKVNKMAQPKLALHRISSTIIPLPPLEEQKEIVRVVEILFKEVEQLESLTKKRIQLKQNYVASALNQLAIQNTQTAWHELTPHFSTFFDDITNIKKLREIILQLAVQGKLTANWRACHPELVEGQHHASELLKSIQQEKAQLIKEKKIKKEKTLPPITPEEIPYELPEGWVWCRIGQLIRFMAYGTSQKTNNDTTQVPVLRMGNITTSGKLVYKNLKYIPHSHKDLPKLFLEKGDLVFNRTNSYDLVGKAGVFKKENNSYTLASYLIKVSLFQEKIYPDYVNNYIISPVCRKTQIVPQITAQTNQANFSGTKLKNVLIPIPPFKEQKAIVEKVNVLMGLCDELEQEVQTSEQQLEDLMQSVLREVFEGKQEVKHDTLPMAAEPEGVYEKSTFDEIFESLNYDYEVAAVVLLTQERFGFTYGKKYVHKMFSNIDFLNELPVFKELQFQEHGWGMFSPILQKTLDNKVHIEYRQLDNNKKSLQVKPKAIPEINKWINAKENKPFVNQVKEMLNIYEQPLIEKSMNRIELLNTVLECMVVLKTTALKDIRTKMENWKMFEGNYKTKAEKFTENETLHMIHFIKGLKSN